jgi:hypothetical protein
LSHPVGARDCVAEHDKDVLAGIAVRRNVESMDDASANFWTFRVYEFPTRALWKSSSVMSR